MIQACCDFLERQLDPSNAIGIAHFAEQHACIELSKKANQYIERRFIQVGFLYILESYCTDYLCV